MVCEKDTSERYYFYAQTLKNSLGAVKRLKEVRKRADRSNGERVMLEFDIKYPLRTEKIETELDDKLLDAIKGGGQGAYDELRDNETTRAVADEILRQNI